MQAHKSLKSIGFFLDLGPVEPFFQKMMFCSFGQKSRTPTQPPLNHPVQKQMQAPKIIPINRLFHRPWPSRAIFQKMMFWPLAKNQGQVHSEPHALLPRNKELTRKNHGLGLGFSLGPGPVSGFFKSHDHQLFHRLHQLFFLAGSFL